MWKKIAIAGATGALILGAGTAALAASGGSSAHPSAGASTAAKARAAKHPALQRMRNFEHGSWVTAATGSGTVTHTAFRGTVSSVSAGSITVKAADGTSGTFTVNSDTGVHTRAKKKDAAISDVKTGDPAIVTGTGTGPVIAKQIVDLAK